MNVGAIAQSFNPPYADRVADLHAGVRMVAVRLAQNSDVPQIAALYAGAGYGGGVDANDAVIIATAGERVVGAVRLCSESGVTVLRGMQVIEAYQRQGIGSQLLEACTLHLDRCLSFCLPYSHLAKFYGAASFEAVHAAELPGFLSARLSSYRTRGQDVIAMRRHGSNQPFQPTPAARLDRNIRSRTEESR